MPLLAGSMQEGHASRVATAQRFLALHRACHTLSRLATVRRMDSPPTLPKKGLGPAGWVGIGCGGIVFLCLVGFAVFSMKFGGTVKQFAEEAAKNPTRTVATTMVRVGMGTFEMVAEDDANKRYTVREKANGKLTTIYWNAKARKAEIIAGDFSAIPTEPAAQ